MRIGKTDFEVGSIGWVHQAVLDAVPEEEAIEEAELRKAYDQVKEGNKPSFEEVLEHLTHLVSRRYIAGRNFYIRRKTWMSSGEVARRLDVSIRTVQAWGQKGVMGARYVGDRLRFAAEQVEELVRGKQRGTSSTQSGSSSATQVWDNEEDAKYDRT
jgi:excisionase family DNA binding protein